MHGDSPRCGQSTFVMDTSRLFNYTFSLTLIGLFHTVESMLL